MNSDIIKDIDIAQMFSLVSEASVRISPYILQTEVMRLPWLDTPNREVWAKLECKQITGSFKIRGAVNALLQIEKSQPIVTYSAGNHGLGVATAAEILGRKCIIYVPANASELKIRKLMRLGAEIECVGEDLAEAGKFAFAKARQINGAFITPFSTPNVVIGQGTIAKELTEQIGFVDSIVIPLGGGGLLCGIGSYIKSVYPNIKIFAPYPEVFNRNFSIGTPSSEMSIKVLPTVADGLAVQNERDSWTTGIIDKLGANFQPVTENLINIGIYSLIRQESIMAEGAGAIGIATLLDDPEGKVISGRTLVVISGGNISPGILSKAFSTQVDNERHRALLGLRSITVQGEAYLPHKRQPTGHSISRTESQPYTKSNCDFWIDLIKIIWNDLTILEDQVRVYENYLSQNDLRKDVETINYIKTEIANVITDCTSLIESTWESAAVYKFRTVYRTILLRYGHLSSLLDWASPSYDQSLDAMFFNPSEQAGNMVNYDRFGSLDLRKFELNLMDILGFDSAGLALFATSSGQAAFQIIESFLLREVFININIYTYVNYVYFEAFEQISSLPTLTGLKFSGNSPQELILFVEENGSVVIFADPISNISGLPVFDLISLARLLENYDWSEKWLVIDGTIISGGLNPFLIFDKLNHPKIIYYESGSKYIQLGLDIQMLGLCIVKKEYATSFAKNRRNTGTVIYKSAIKKFPHYTRSLFLYRMQLISANAAKFANHIINKWNSFDSIIVGYPFNWKELGWLYGGALVTIEFAEQGLNNRDKLNALIDSIIRESKKEEISVSNGVSFGFNNTRISAASAMAVMSDPFLRFSVGEETQEEIDILVDIVIRCLDRYINSSS